MNRQRHPFARRDPRPLLKPHAEDREWKATVAYLRHMAPGLACLAVLALLAIVAVLWAPTLP